MEWQHTTKSSPNSTLRMRVDNDRSLDHISQGEDMQLRLTNNVLFRCLPLWELLQLEGMVARTARQDTTFSHWFSMLGIVSGHLFSPAVIDAVLSLHVCQCVHHCLAEQQCTVMHSPETQRCCMKQGAGVRLRLKSK